MLKSLRIMSPVFSNILNIISLFLFIVIAGKGKEGGTLQSVEFLYYNVIYGHVYRLKVT